MIRIPLILLLLEAWRGPMELRWSPSGSMCRRSPVKDPGTYG